ENERIIKPLGAAPIRFIDAVFHYFAVEVLVGKAIDGENIGALGVKPLLKCGYFPGASELLGRFIGQPQPNSERMLRRQPCFKRWNMGLQLRKNLLPTFTGVNVGTVAEMGMTVF